MAGIGDIAKDEKLDTIRCPHCGKHFRTFGLLKAVFAAIARRLEKGEMVRILNFGTFEVRKMKPRGPYSPLTGSKIEATRRIRFKMARAIRERLNKKTKSKKRG